MDAAEIGWKPFVVTVTFFIIYNWQLVNGSMTFQPWRPFSLSPDFRCERIYHKLHTCDAHRKINKVHIAFNVFLQIFFS